LERNFTRIFYIIKENFWSQEPQEGGGPRLAQPTRARPPPVVIGSSIFLLLYKNSPKSFVPIRELLFLHKNNTMVVLLKTTSFRVSFIQIMQIRVQNKRKSVRKSRYNGDVSTPPSLNLCLSSSNSVDKLKVKKKNFYEPFCSCLQK
jgi:hypothetical protein